MEKSVLIIGAGPAGLTAGYLLTQAGWKVTLLEADPTYVGGISKTVSHKGFHFDIGGHRFFSKSEEVNKLWREILPDDFIETPRSSRIYYRNELFSYPLKGFEALKKLGLVEAILCVLSYFKVQLFPITDPKNFKDWVTNQFGERLFNIFFKTYTEKVWGMKCEEISADWASQRIQGLSLGKAIINSILPQKKNSKLTDLGPKTLINYFFYPRKGPGMMWETAAAKILVQGGEVLMGHQAKKIIFNRDLLNWKIIAENKSGALKEFTASHLISSCPLRELINNLTPEVNFRVSESANSLRYRDFICVSVMLKNFKGFKDNWIYIHDPSVKVGRIQNFKSWSPEMTPGPEFDCLGLEYFCFESDGLWNLSDTELGTLAIGELVKLKLIDPQCVIDTFVVRQKKAYPIYDDSYTQSVKIIRNELEEKFSTLHTIGRNGMHRYNNQDHAMMTAMLTVKNILSNKKVFDVWKINQDAQYIEVINNKENVIDFPMLPQKVA